jgi:hypothetical protein
LEVCVWEMGGYGFALTCWPGRGGAVVE